MPIINAQILRGRTGAQKKAFLEDLVELVVRRLDVPEGAVRVLLTEFEPEDWMSGAKSMAELTAAKPGGGKGLVTRRRP